MIIHFELVLSLRIWMLLMAGELSDHDPVYNIVHVVCNGPHPGPLPGGRGSRFCISRYDLIFAVESVAAVGGGGGVDGVAEGFGEGLDAGEAA